MSRANCLCSLKTGTAPIPTWQFASAPRPTPCESTFAGAVSHSWRAPSTPGGKAEDAHATPRLYLCARCGEQVLICCCCDRGNIYCEQGCATASRRTKQRAAGRRYQSSFRGRRNHAARARSYRARQNKVTHQGSLPPSPDVVIRARAASTRQPKPTTPRAPPLQPPWRCHWCGQPCSPFVRTNFLRRGRGRDP